MLIIYIIAFIPVSGSNGDQNLISDQWPKTDTLKRKELIGNPKSSEALQHNQNQHKLQTYSDSCLKTSCTWSDSEGYETPLCMICFNILSKAESWQNFMDFQIPHTVTVHTIKFFKANWKIEIKVEKCCSGQLQVMVIQRQWFLLLSSFSGKKGKRKIQSGKG